MSIVQQDYILRMIEQMGELILAALRLKKSGALLESDQTLTDALITVLPEHADLIEMVDERTAGTLLGDPRLVEGYSTLLLERAESKYRLGQETEAEMLQKRAVRIFMIHFLRHGNLSPEGHLIFGRISGLELELLLDQSELSNWRQLAQITA